jgi:SAM-dependent methyltransferase
MPQNSSTSWNNATARDLAVQTFAKQIMPNSKILDLGAGRCPYKPLFAHCDYKTQDFTAYKGTADGLLKDSWEYGTIDYVCDATAIPVADGTFDVILCTEVLEHVPEPILVLKEISRLLKPGGYAFITAPLGSGLHQQPYHFYGGYTPHFYQKFLTDFGCEVKSIEPNGRFFALLSQEIRRGVGLIRGAGLYSPMNPVYWLLKLLKGQLVKNWLLYLDQKILVDEFTVGYHVTAQKKH